MRNGTDARWTVTFCCPDLTSSFCSCSKPTPRAHPHPAREGF